jgi:hypothetical protein
VHELCLLLASVNHGPWTWSTVHFSEMLVNSYKTIWHLIPGNSGLNIRDQVSHP